MLTWLKSFHLYLHDPVVIIPKQLLFQTKNNISLIMSGKKKQTSLNGAF